MDLLARALHLGRSKPGLDDQKSIGNTLKKMKSAHEIHVKILPDDLFPNGRIYFEVGGRMFAGDNTCANCTIIHNNWIVGQPAKRYRFKEHLLWYIDTHGYYSSASRKYMMYDNPDNFGAKLTFANESAALKSAFAIAHILNRTLILPRFHCGKKLRNKPTKYCYAGVFYKIKNLDRELPYRESVFLRHPLVPNAVKLSLSPVLEIIRRGGVARHNSNHTFTANETNGATKTEVAGWFGNYSHFAVLRFRCLYGAFARFDTLGQFQRNLKDGLVPGTYTQKG